MAHEEITQIQRFIGDGSDMPTTGVLPGSIYYKIVDEITVIEKYIFYDGSWYPVEIGGGGG